MSFVQVPTGPGHYPTLADPSPNSLTRKLHYLYKIRTEIVTIVPTYDKQFSVSYMGIVLYTFDRE